MSMLHKNNGIKKKGKKYDARPSLGRNGNLEISPYGVATVSRFDKIIGLFCRISSLL